MTETTNRDNLTEEQSEAVNSTAQNLILLAGAGTGKTHTSIARLKHLILSKNIKADNILCLTFTRSAAEEFKMRCADLPETPFIGTFHEFCYRLVLSNSAIMKCLGYSSVPKILEDFEDEEYRAKVKLQMGIKLSNKKLNNRSLCTPKDIPEYEAFHSGLKMHFRKDCVINFDYLCQEVCNLFIKNNPAIKRYKQQYRYIFVDEFQNTDDTQWNFVKSFTESNRFLVGDMMQSIYLFRNASPQIVKDIVGNPEWTVLKLTTNFRSNQEILDYANKIHPSDKYEDYRIDLVSSQGQGGHCEVVDVSNRESLEKFLITDLESLESKDIAILTRTNWDVQKIQSLLEANGIPYTTNNSNTITEFEHFIHSVQSNEYMLTYLTSKLSGNQYYEFLGSHHFGELKEQTTTDTIKHMYNNYGTVIGSLVHKVNKFRSVLFSQKTTYEKYRELCDVVDMPPIDAYEQVFVEDTTNAALYDAILDTFETNHKDSSSGIYVGTIHSAQGLEYDTTIITDVGSKEFKIDTDENKFLYYVGVTRAKHRLIVYKYKIT